MPCDKTENLKSCRCTNYECVRRGLCCACVRNHRDKGEIPACFFPSEVEKEHDRSIERFIKCHSK